MLPRFTKFQSSVKLPPIPEVPEEHSEGSGESGESGKHCEHPKHSINKGSEKCVVAWDARRNMHICGTCINKNL